jgi:hypothetical protein
MVLKTDNSVPEKEKKERLAMLEEVLQKIKPIQFKDNVSLVRKYNDKLPPLTKGEREKHPKGRFRQELATRMRSTKKPRRSCQAGLSNRSGEYMQTPPTGSYFADAGVGIETGRIAALVASVCREVGRPDHLAPLFSFVGDEFLEFGRCLRHRVNA